MVCYSRKIVNEVLFGDTGAVHSNVEAMTSLFAEQFGGYFALSSDKNMEYTDQLFNVCV